ncbi:hypothetical protein [Mycolicibacterium elephantis]|uniref:Twin-arginine translocation pathway signal n=1 Tax=Mycolicibacterium elephantis DSM 44368 TaxID=1335622 RepID=A0A439DLZ6_9MYCO|nr:hypothetical protein [Mycolicibacterium elephantis]MCV7224123.1 hypothetical protein [Mycolicibacterium elephantis]RWA15683.1 hypothetical protein MELE44368_09265 [Mycolicibacterium elephantis DSM 44368]
MTVDENADVTTESPETDEAVEAAEGTEETTEKKAPKRSTGAIRRHLGAILVPVALIAAAGATAWVYFGLYRPTQQTDEAAKNVVLEAAKNATVAMLSYSPDTLDQDFAAAKSNLTGDFLSYYTQFTEQIVTPAAKEKNVKTSAAVVRAAVSEMQPDSAEVLVFVNQVTTSKENPDGAFAASSVKVGMEKIDGRWLIAQFDPV